MFITFEGIDGCGKTTQIRRLAETLRQRGYKVTLTREPGGSPGAEEIRSLLLNGEPDRWSAQSEILLFTVARRDHVEKCILPNLEDSSIVLCDRFLDSTRAYQGQKGKAYLDMVNQLHELMIGKMPDLTLLLDMKPEIALSRSLARLADTDAGEDRFEKAGLDFQKGLRAVYHDILREEPERITYIPADAAQDVVAAYILDQVEAALEKRGNALSPKLEI